jgi:DNA-binding PadR family transcriptional regulator
MHKELHLLGLLLSGPKSGYVLHRIVVAHGDLFADLKKGNVYYLLERLAQSGALQVSAEAGAPGPRRERLVYELTDRGRARFHELLREVVRGYEPAHSGVEVGMIFLSSLQPGEAIELLRERREAVATRRAVVQREMHEDDRLPVQLAQDHLLSMIDAELGWIDRTLRRLRERQEADAAPLETDSRHGQGSVEVPAAQPNQEKSSYRDVNPAPPAGQG